MNIKDLKFSFKENMLTRKKTNYIVLHHRGGAGDAESIHQTHIKNGWAGIGYHFYIRKSGEIISGRPLIYQGAHASGFNDKSVGICFEGDFEKENITNDQIKSGRWLVSYLKEKYPSAKVVMHKDLCPTLCPGKNFPFDAVLNKEEKPKKYLETANDITWELKQIIKIEDTNGFVTALDEAKKNNSPLYWGYYKIVNKGG